MKLRFSALAIAAVLLTGQAAWATPTLVTNGGGANLIGVNGVTVGALTYDITFNTSGSCVTLYSSCSVFPFPSLASGDTAMAAFASQMGSAAGFASVTNLNGFPITGFSSLLLPYAVVAGTEQDVVYQFVGGAGNPPTFVANTTSPPAAVYDCNIDNPRCYTLWSVETAAVPEPMTLSLFAVGAAGAIGLRRRRKAICQI